MKLLKIIEKWKDHMNIVLCAIVELNENKGHISCPKNGVLIFSFCINVICMSGIQTPCWDEEGYDRIKILIREQKFVGTQEQSQN